MARTPDEERDDYLECPICRRRSWDAAEKGLACGAEQPDGSKCPGEMIGWP